MVTNNLLHLCRWQLGNHYGYIILDLIENVKEKEEVHGQTLHSVFAKCSYEHVLWCPSFLYIVLLQISIQLKDCEAKYLLFCFDCIVCVKVYAKTLEQLPSQHSNGAVICCTPLQIRLQYCVVQVTIYTVIQKSIHLRKSAHPLQWEREEHVLLTMDWYWLYMVTFLSNCIINLQHLHLLNAN